MWNSRICFARSVSCFQQYASACSHFVKVEKQNKVKSSAKAKSANYIWLLCIVQGGYIKFALNYITFFFIMYNKIWFMCLQCAFYLWYASSDAQPIWFSRSFCCRPEVLPVSAGVPVWVHRRCRDRWWGEHRWVQFNKAQSIHLLLKFHLLHHINQIFFYLISLLFYVLVSRGKTVAVPTCIMRALVL